MHDSLRMCVAQCISNFAEDSRRFIHRQLACSREPGAQVFAADERHCVVEEIAARARSKKGNDVRMLKPRSELNLPTKAVAIQPCREIGRENLDNNLSSELGLRRDKYTRHSPTAELAVDLVDRGEYFLQLALKIGRQAPFLGLECPNYGLSGLERPIHTFTKL